MSVTFVTWQKHVDKDQAILWTMLTRKWPVGLNRGQRWTYTEGACTCVTINLHCACNEHHDYLNRLYSLLQGFHLCLQLDQLLMLGSILVL